MEPQVATESVVQVLETETCVSDTISRMHMYQKNIMFVSVSLNTCVGKNTMSVSVSHNKPPCNTDTTATTKNTNAATSTSHCHYQVCPSSNDQH